MQPFSNLIAESQYVEQIKEALSVEHFTSQFTQSKVD